MRYIVEDTQGLHLKLQSLYSTLKSSKFQRISEDEFLERIQNPGNDAFLVYGRKVYDKITDLNKAHKIHIGLRSFTYVSFTALPQVRIGDHRLVFGDRPTFEEGIEPKYEYFISNALEKDPLPLPTTTNVGLKEGVKILQTVFMPDTTSWVGLDFETSGLPKEEVFRISGFALYKQDIAYFFDFRKDYGYRESKRNTQTEYDRSSFLIAFQQYLDTHSSNIWAFNCSFEMEVLFRMYRKIYYIQDAMALAIADDQRKSLKYDVQYYLATPSWDDALGTEQDYIKTIVKHHKTAKDFESTLYLIIDSTEPEKFFKKGDELYQEACIFYIRDMVNGGKLMDMLKEYWDLRPEWYACDPEKLGIYCCYDSFYCVKLAEKLFPAYGTTCYPVFLFNRYLGMELEMSGIKVDIPKAKRYAKYCQNILSNYEIFLNRIYLKSYMRRNSDYGTIIAPYASQRIIAQYPEVCQADPVKITKGILKRLCPDKPGWSIPLNFLNEMIGYDVSDELMSVLDEEAMKEGLDSYIRKKKTAEPIGLFIQQIIGLSYLVEEFNRIAIPKVKPILEQYKQEVRPLWVPMENDIAIENAYLAIDVARAWYKKYKLSLTGQLKTKTVTFLETLQTQISKARATGVSVCEVGEIEDTKLMWLLMKVRDAEALKEQKLESDLDKLYLVRNLDDSHYMQFDLTTILPGKVVEYFADEAQPEISAYRYWRLRSCHKELDTIPVVRITEDPFVNSIYSDRDKLYIKKVCNYNSNDQFPSIFGRTLELEYKDQYLVLCSLWNYMKQEGVDKNPDIVRDLVKQFEAHLDILRYSDDAKNLFTPEVEVGREYDWRKREWNIQTERQKAVWKREFISDGVTHAEEYFQYLFDDPKAAMTNEVPDDPYQLIAKLGFMTDFAGVAGKELGTYVTNLLNGTHKIFYEGVHSGYFSDNGEKDTYLPSFKMNTLATKRCTSEYHTFLPHSDSLKLLIVEPGRIKTYFDVSQMEPRSICYISNDPVFKDIYDSGKDAYMELAKITWPDHANDPDFKAKYRTIAKTCMISSIYGQGDAGLAARAGVTTERVTEMKKAMFGTWKEVDRLRQHKLHYLETTGEIETFLGDRLRGDKEDAFTTAVNYGNQGNASVVANEGFELSVMNIRALNIDVSVESVIHDSNQNNLPIVDLFEADICYRNFFRKYINEKYGIDFKYDLDIMYNSCEHMSYSLDVDTLEGKISGPKKSVDYVFTYLKEPDITIISDEVEENPDKGMVDPIGEFIKNPTGGPRAKPHYICDYEEFLNPYIRTVKFKVNRKIRNIDTAKRPLGVPSYFNRVKRWSEHLIPGFKDNEEKNANGKSLGICDAPNKIYPVDIANKILAS